MNFVHHIASETGTGTHSHRGATPQYGRDYGDGGAVPPPPDVGFHDAGGVVADAGHGDERARGEGGEIAAAQGRGKVSHFRDLLLFEKNFTNENLGTSLQNSSSFEELSSFSKEL